jgi:hypothetical protein
VLVRIMGLMGRVVAVVLTRSMVHIRSPRPPVGGLPRRSVERVRFAGE